MKSYGSGYFERLHFGRDTTNVDPFNQNSLIMRNQFYTLFMSVCFIFGSLTLQAQTPSLTVTGTDVCSAYIGLCCQTSYIDVAGTLPAGWSVYQTNLTQFGFFIPSGQSVAPSYDPSIPAFYGTFPSYELKQYSIYGGTYSLNITFDTGSGYITVSYPFTITIDNSAASPSIQTHAKTVGQLQASQTFATTFFYLNEPISFDGTGSADTYEYYLACTRVDQYGATIGSTVTDFGPYYSPEVPYGGFGYNDLRYMFSNLVDPSGLEVYRYYRIDMYGTGCDDDAVQVSKTIRIKNTARPSRSMLAPASLTAQLSVAPNPSAGRFSLTSNEVIKEIKISIKSLTGQEVYSQESVEFTSATVDLSSLSKGMYLVTCIADGEESVQRIEIQ